MEEKIEKFTIFKNTYKLLRHLPEKNKLELYDAMFDYMFEGIESEFNDELSDGIWVNLKMILDNTKSRIINGKKGGRNSNANDLGYENQEPRREPNYEPNPKPKIETKPQANTVFLISNFFISNFNYLDISKKELLKNKLLEWNKYKIEKKKKYTETGINNLLKQIDKYLKKYAFQCVRKWEFVNEQCSSGQRTLSNSRWRAIMCRGEVVNEEETQQLADVSVDNPTLPLPLEEDTSAALEEAAAEPTFRDLPIAWENVTTEENGKQRTGHWIVWNGNRSKREEFFKLAFPDQYNKVKKRVKFLGQAADDVLRLTGGQRTKLMYEILAWKYGLEEVDEQDSLDLIWFCKREEDNKTADDLLSRLHWPNGLAKLVTFGVGMKLDGAAQQTWCYSVDYQEDRALFTGSSMTWERWQVKLIEVLDRCRACRYSYSKMWK